MGSELQEKFIDCSPSWRERMRAFNGRWGGADVVPMVGQRGQSKPQVEQERETFGKDGVFFPGYTDWEQCWEVATPRWLTHLPKEQPTLFPQKVFAQRLGGQAGLGEGARRPGASLGKKGLEVMAGGTTLRCLVSPAPVYGGQRKRWVLRRQGACCSAVGVHSHVGESD